MSPGGSAKPPPEEKLLRLIRGKGARSAAGDTPPPEAQPVAGAAAATAPAKPAASGGGRSLPAWPWIKVAMGLLGVIVMAEVGVLIWQVAWPVPPLTTQAAALPPTQAAAAPVVPMIEEFPSVAAGGSRVHFTTPVARTPAFTAPSGTVTSLVSRLTLTGIVEGDPAQAIIEDSETKKTYFVTAGQSVVEGAVLEQVSETGVVLNFAGERIDLTL